MSGPLVPACAADPRLVDGDGELVFVERDGQSERVDLAEHGALDTGWRLFAERPGADDELEMVVLSLEEAIEAWPLLADLLEHIDADEGAWELGEPDAPDAGR